MNVKSNFVLSILLMVTGIGGIWSVTPGPPPLPFLHTMWHNFSFTTPLIHVKPPSFTWQYGNIIPHGKDLCLYVCSHDLWPLTSGSWYYKKLMIQIISKLGLMFISCFNFSGNIILHAIYLCFMQISRDFCKSRYFCSSAHIAHSYWTEHSFVLKIFR